MTFLELQQELAARGRLDLNEGNQATLVKRWINQSQQEIWGRHDWPWALDREIVQTVIDITAGTVSVSAGGQAVTGASTAFTSADIGKFIQFSSSDDWYKVTAVSSTTALTIESPYLRTSALTAGTYKLRKVLYNTSASVERVLDVRQTITPAKLTLIPYRTFDQYRPSVTAESDPTAYVLYGMDSSNRWLFSLHPNPDTALNLEVRFKKIATLLSLDADVSVIPVQWHSTVLFDGALYRGLEYARTGDNDKRAEFKQRQFEEGISRMVAECEPESDSHIVLRNNDRLLQRFGPMLPNDFDQRGNV